MSGFERDDLGRCFVGRRLRSRPIAARVAKLRTNVLTAVNFQTFARIEVCKYTKFR